MPQIGAPQVFDAVNKTDDIQNHHPKPHTYMEVKVTNGFIQNGKTRNIQEEAGNNRVGRQNNG